MQKKRTREPQRKVPKLVVLYRTINDDLFCSSFWILRRYLWKTNPVFSNAHVLHSVLEANVFQKKGGRGKYREAKNIWRKNNKGKQIRHDWLWVDFELILFLFSFSSHQSLGAFVAEQISVLAHASWIVRIQGAPNSLFCVWPCRGVQLAMIKALLQP